MVQKCSIYHGILLKNRYINHFKHFQCNIVAQVVKYPHGVGDTTTTHATYIKN